MGGPAFVPSSPEIVVSALTRRADTARWWLTLHRLSRPHVALISRQSTSALGASGHILLPKDYIRWRLTGIRNTDPSDASGTYLFDVHQRFWSDTLIEPATIHKDQLLAVLPSQSVVGVLRSGIAQSLGLPEDRLC